MKKFITLLLLGSLALGATAQIVDAELATKPADKTVFYQTPVIEKKNTFIVVSKTELRLYVYGTVGKDTVLMATSSQLRRGATTLGTDAVASRPTAPGS